MSKQSFGCVPVLALTGVLIVFHASWWIVGGVVAVAVLWRIATLPLPMALPEADQRSPEDFRPWSKPRALPGVRDGARFWRAPGQSGKAAASDDLGEMIYVCRGGGRGLRRISGRTAEPALIDLTLPVASGAVDGHTRLMDYWPSYHTCSPEARAAYLAWLRGGRRDPRAYIGYVFLYFYGLERRALHDARTDPSALEERSAILAEVERLLSIYGGNASFHRYGTAFRDLLTALDLPPKAYRRAPVPHPGQPLTGLDRSVLAQCAQDGAPLPAAWAWQWVSHEPGMELGTVAQRCPGELAALFAELYQARYGEGMTLPVARRSLRLEYQPASASFGQALSVDAEISDVSGARVVRELGEIAGEARDRLARYSRKLGKTPTAPAEALLVLPLSLWPAARRASLQGLVETVRQAPGPLERSLAQLWAALPEGIPLNRANLRALCELLAGRAVGMEPDPRFGGSLPRPPSSTAASQVVLFADDPATASAKPTALYAGAAAMLQLAAAVAGADGQWSEAEQGVILGQLQGSPGLTESERRRLTALLHLTRLEPPRTAVLKRRLAALPPQGREAVGDYLVEVARAGKTITADEIRALQRSFKLLGLDAEGVFARVHAAQAAPAGQPRKARGQTPTPAPTRPSPAGGVALDAEKVARLQADSAAVTALLASVFAGEPHEGDPTQPGSSPPDSFPAASVLRLDAPAARFLQTLLAKDFWGREELAALARAQGLPLDGVLEQINEAAYDTLDLPLLEEGDPVQVNPEAVAALASAGRAGGPAS